MWGSLVSLWRNSIRIGRVGFKISLQITIFLIATQVINTPARAKNTLIFDLIRHKYRQHPRVAIHMVPCDLAACEEAYQGDVAQGFADDL